MKWSGDRTEGSMSPDAIAVSFTLD